MKDEQSDPPPAEVLPVRVYTSESGLRRPGDMLRGLFDGLFSREAWSLAKRLIVRNILAQYRESFLSFFWVLIPPLVTSGVWIFLNRLNILRVGETVLPYPVFVLTGTLLWQAFTGALNAPRNAIGRERSLLTRMSFPREALLLVGLGELLFETVIQFAFLIPVCILYKIHFSPLMLLGPLGVGAVILLGYAVGLLLTPLGLLVADVGRAISIVARLGYFVTPIMYPMPKGGLAGALASLNPVAPLVETAREWLTGQPASLLGPFWAVTAVSVVALLAALIIFRLAMPIVIERLSA